MTVKTAIQEFISHLQTDEDAELYNEAGLQHELAWFLRGALGKDYLVKLEYPIAKAGVPVKLVKKEMDIFIRSKTTGDRYCIELKAPVNLQIPKRMFHALQDVQFLAALKNEHGFQQGFLIFVTNNDSFWKPKADKLGIYKLFRKKVVTLETIVGDDVPDFIRKEYTEDPILFLDRVYTANWEDLKVQGEEKWRYFLVEV